MPLADDEWATTDSSEAMNGQRRRRLAVVGGAGLAAVLGIGGVLIADPFAGGSTQGPELGVPPAPTATTGVADPATPSTEAVAPAPSRSTAPVRKSAAAASASARPQTSRAVAEEIRKAREAAEKDGNPLRRALEPQAAAAGGEISVRNEGSMADGGTMRIVSAPFDLTGQAEQAWAADDGKRVGAARCTQNFRFSNDEKARERPTMLLCWRTSQSRSVVTVAVSRTGRPSAAASVDTIDREWRKLG